MIDTNFSVTEWSSSLVRWSGWNPSGGRSSICQRGKTSKGWAYLCIVLLVYNMLDTVSAGNTRWCGLGLAEQISRADFVAKANVVSRSAVQGGSYLATFRVEKLVHSTGPEIGTKFLRLQILSPNLNSQKKCPIAAKVKPHTEYILMVKYRGRKPYDQVGAEDMFGSRDDYSLVAPPLRATKSNLKELKSHLCLDCGGQKTSQREVKKRHSRHNREEYIEEKEGSRDQMRLTCSARGNPPPTLYWTMNDRIVENSPYAKINTKKISKYLRKSVLKLSVPVNRTVDVQCHAYNSYGHTSRVKLNTISTTTTTTTTTTTPAPPPVVHRRPNNQYSQLRRVKSISAFSGENNPMLSVGCPVENYCMNGGTCKYYADIGELTCHCSRGFQGRRCERKYVSGGPINGPKMSEKLPICIFGIGHYPCT